MLKNNQVALCVDNIQIEGKAIPHGHPLSEENSAFIATVAENKQFMSATRYKNAVLYEVEPRLIEMWIEGKRLFLDINKHTCFLK